MNKIWSLLGASILPFAFASAAHATETESKAERAESAQEADKADKADKKLHAKYPMKAVEFKTKVNDNIAKAKDRLESRLKDKRIKSERAKVARARFDRGVVEVRRVVDKVTKDGTVTLDEAKEVKAKTKVIRTALRTH